MTRVAAGVAAMCIAASVAAMCIGSAAHHPTAGVASTRIATIAVTKTCTDEAGTVKPAADKERSISAFKEGAIVGIIVIIPIVPVPGRKVIVEIPGKIVFIDDAIAAGIAIGVGIHILSGIRILVRIGILVGIGILISRILVGRVRRCISGSRCSIRRSRSAIDHRGRRYVNAGPAKTDPGAYIYLGITLGSDQHACDGQGGQCKELFHCVCDFKLAAKRLFQFRFSGI